MKFLGISEDGGRCMKLCRWLTSLAQTLKYYFLWMKGKEEEESG